MLLKASLVHDLVATGSYGVLPNFLNTLAPSLCETSRVSFGHKLVSRSFAISHSTHEVLRDFIANKVCAAKNASLFDRCWP